MIKKWKNEKTGNPIEVSQNLVKLATDLYQQAIVEEQEEMVDSNNENESTIDVEKALQSGEYKKYREAVSELGELDILEMNNLERIAFFLNIYQCMYVHNFLRMVSESDVDNQDSN